MKLKAKVFSSNGKFSFDVLDMDDVVTFKDEVIPECLYTSSREYANESTAERNCDEWIDRFNKAGEPERRRLCGYDSVTACRPIPRPVSALRKANSPAR